MSEARVFLSDKEPSTMSTQETDAQPAPGPWDWSPQEGSTGHCIQAQVWDSNGDCVAAIDSLLSIEEANANARLIAAAGTAGHEAAEMGYDPVAAVEALPELLRAAEEGSFSAVKDALASAEGDHE